MENLNINSNTVVIRKANPDYEEGLLFADYLNDASEGFFKSILGKETLNIIAEAFVKPINDYSYENVLFIEYKSNIVGMVSGYKKSEKESFKRKILKQYSKGCRYKIWMFTVVGGILSRLLGSQKKDDFYIQAIAINSQLRGMGFGQKLMEKITVTAIEKGSKTLSLDVSSKNVRAIKSYTKFGMRVSSTWPNFLNIPPIFTKMEKRL